MQGVPPTRSSIGCPSFIVMHDFEVLAMPKSTRQTKSQDVYTRISVRLEHGEMSTDASINHDVHSPQYAIRLDDEDPLFKYMIRARWLPDTRHTLAGEIDKSGHPLIRGNGLDNCKPDFLVHLPGEMEGNYAAIEVKPVTAKRRDVVKDIETSSPSSTTAATSVESIFFMVTVQMAKGRQSRHQSLSQGHGCAYRDLDAHGS